MDIDDAFDRFVAAGDPPTFVVSVRAGEKTDACLVGFATQCSIAPRRFAVCISEVNRTWRLVAEGPVVLAVHRLRQGDDAVAEWFGGHTGDDVAPFGDYATTPGPDGVPLIDALGDRLIGREHARVDAGDHVLIVLEPIAVHGDAEAEPFTLADAGSIDPGHPADD